MSCKYKKSKNREQKRDRKLSKIRKDLKKMKGQSDELRKELASYKPMIEDMRKHVFMLDACITLLISTNIPNFYDRTVPLGELDTTQRQLIRTYYDADKVRTAAHENLDAMNNLLSMARKAVENPILLVEIIGSKIQPAVFELSEYISRYFLILQEMMQVGGDKLREAGATNSTFAEVVKFYDTAVAQNEAYKMSLVSEGVDQIPEATEEDREDHVSNMDEAPECSSDTSCDSSDSSSSSD